MSVNRTAAPLVVRPSASSPWVIKRRCYFASRAGSVKALAFTSPNGMPIFTTLESLVLDNYRVHAKIVAPRL